MRAVVVQGEAALGDEIEIVGNRVLDPGHQVEGREVLTFVVIDFFDCDVEPSVELEPSRDMGARQQRQIDARRIGESIAAREMDAGAA